MPQPNLIDALLYGSASIFGWITVDVFANLLLRKDETGAKFRFIGAALTVIVIGLVLLWVALILLAVAFFEMRTEPTQPQTTTTSS